MDISDISYKLNPYRNFEILALITDPLIDRVLLVLAVIHDVARHFVILQSKLQYHTVCGARTPLHVDDGSLSSVERENYKFSYIIPQVVRTGFTVRKSPLNVL